MRVTRRARRPWTCALLAVLMACLVLCNQALVVGIAAEGDETEAQTFETTTTTKRKAIFETPYLCRLGKRYPWIRTFVEDRLHLYGRHIEWRETGGNPRLIVFDGDSIKALLHFRDEHKDVERIIREKLEL